MTRVYVRAEHKILKPIISELKKRNKTSPPLENQAKPNNNEV